MKEVKVAANIENIPAVTAFIDEQLEALSCPMKAQMQIDIAMDELFGNIAHYAYGRRMELGDGCDKRRPAGKSEPGVPDREDDPLSAGGATLHETNEVVAEILAQTGLDTILTVNDER